MDIESNIFFNYDLSLKLIELIGDKIDILSDFFLFFLVYLFIIEVVLSMIFNLISQLGN